MVFLLFLASCLFVIAFVFGVLYFNMLSEYKILLKEYDRLSDYFGKAVTQRNKLEKDNKRYSERLEKWRKEIDRLHEQYSYLYQPCD